MTPAQIGEQVRRLPTGDTLGTEALGVFGPNKAAPLHRWVSFTEGFSAQLVARELEVLQPEAVVFDPFGGTGTTPLVAAQLGHLGLWAEVNPYLREAAEVKIAIACAGRAIRRRLAKDLREAVVAGPAADGVSDEHPLLIANRERDFFESGAARALVGWVGRFDACDLPLAGRLGRVAAASCAVSVSNMKRAVDLRRRTPRELQRPRPDVTASIRKRIKDFLDDLEIADVANGSARWVSPDARLLPSELPPVDVVVTSPPYLNGTNYCRNTKLELLLLRLISGEGDLGSLRSRAITAGINNVSRRIRTPEVLDQVEPTANELDRVAYDVRIPKMVRAYFSDMRVVFGELVPRMRSGGRLVLDIGDSRFAGVHVDTPRILLELAESAGWVAEDSQTIRSRVAKDGNPLCQKLLYLSSP